MTKKNPKKLTAALSLILALFFNHAFAENAPAKKESNATIFYLKQDEVKKFYDEFFSENYYKKFPEIVGKDDPSYDSDVELSLDELRKKYPLDWVEKKFGKTIARCCKDFDSPKKPKQCPEDLVCGLYSNYEVYIEEPLYYFFKKVNMEDLSEAELKSIFVNDSKDPRAKDVIKIVYDYFYHHRSTPQRDLSETDKKLRSFIFSPKIFLTSIRRIDSMAVCNSSYNNAFLKPPYTEDLIFLLTLQKVAFEHADKNIGNYMSYGGKIFDHYTPNNKKIFKALKDQPTLFVECSNTFSAEERNELDRKFKDKFLTTKTN